MSQNTKTDNGIIEIDEESLLQDAVTQNPLPEAGGVAWIDLFTPEGAKISLTARSISAEQALRDLVVAVKNAISEHGMATSRSQSKTSPQAKPALTQNSIPMGDSSPEGAGRQGAVANYDNGAGGSHIEEVTFTGLKTEIAPNGEMRYKGMTPKFAKYGIMIWPEVAEKAFDLDQLKEAGPQNYEIDLVGKVLFEPNKNDYMSPKKVLSWVKRK